MKLRIYFKEDVQPILADEDRLKESDLYSYLNTSDEWVQLGQRIINKSLIAHIEIISVS